MAHHDLQDILDSIPASLRESLSHLLNLKKACPYDERWVLSAFFPPVPGPAFDVFCRHMFVQPDIENVPASVTLGVTNQCDFNCWHCYNAGRSQQELPLDSWKNIAATLQDRGVALVVLTGGEPLQRTDLEQICASFDERTAVIVFTNGWHLTRRRAQRLKESGVFAVCVSLDSDIEDEHDRLRGRRGAFRAAARALGIARDAELYAYACCVARPPLLHTDRFARYLKLVQTFGALEVRVLEPVPVGRLADRPDAVLDGAMRERLKAWDIETAEDLDRPILTTFTRLGAPEAFGCQAGWGHLYIDGTGEVSPCNLLPLSFGNVTREDLSPILRRMRTSLGGPRCTCAARWVAERLPREPLPVPPDQSQKLCFCHLPPDAGTPAMSTGPARS